jgi:4-hydroxy-4-methyl-2-oxoglutarate aldolase
VNKLSSEYYAYIEENLYTAVLSDILDSVGYRQQVMRHDLRPLYPTAKMAGRAATMMTTEIFEIPNEPYKLELVLLDDLKPGEIVVCATQGSTRAALWGELLSTHARAKGGRGALIDGLSRDTVKIIEMQFPVFALGMLPTDSRGRLDVVAIRQPVKIGEVVVQDGDLIVADLDGCVAIPQAVEDQVIEEAFSKVSAENLVRDLLRKGTSIQQVFSDYGVL